VSSEPSQAGVAALLARLEEISRGRADRVLRLSGVLHQASLHPEPVGPGLESPGEPFELLIYRGFSSSTTHPTGFDPDQPALADGALITEAELLRGPLNPAAEERLAGPGPAEGFLEPGAWL